MFEIIPMDQVALGIFPIIALAIGVLAAGAQVAGGVIQTNQAKRAERARRGAEELEAQRERLRAVRKHASGVPRSNQLHRHKALPAVLLLLGHKQVLEHSYRLI